MNLSELRDRLFITQKGRCCWCNLTMDRTGKGGRGITLDHIIPRAKGGTDLEENLTAACRLCNAARGDMDTETFRAARAHHTGRGLPVTARRRSGPARFRSAT